MGKGQEKVQAYRDRWKMVLMAGTQGKWKLGEKSKSTLSS